VSYRDAVDAVIYGRCWKWRQAPSNLSISCSTGHIISIQSAEVWASKNNCDRKKNCTSTHQTGIMTCNRQRNCSFPYHILDITWTCYDSGAKGYNISITYNCIRSKRSFLFHCAI